MAKTNEPHDTPATPPATALSVIVDALKAAGIKATVTKAAGIYDDVILVAIRRPEQTAG